MTQTQANKRAKKEDVEEPGVSIILERQVSLTFSLKYLTNFAKSAPLAREVTLHMSNDVPLLVQFEFEQGTLQFFLAPKVSDHLTDAAKANGKIRLRTSKIVYGSPSWYKHCVQI